MVQVTVAIKAARDSVEMLRLLAPSVQHARRQAADVEEAKKLLGLADPKGEAYRSDAVHPLYKLGQIHPDNLAALSVAGSDALIRKPAVQDNLETDAAARSLLLFGSPTSEGLSRIAFDYDRIPGVEGLTRRGGVIDLPYVWELDPNRLGPGRVGRQVPGKGIVERPAWQINDLRGSGGRQPLRPEADAAGMISEDYLLVTRMRNFLSEEALGLGRFLVSFGGAHGTGTRAVELLLRDRKLLANVLECLREKQVQTTGRVGGVPKAYQLLFRVSKIKHGPKGSIPHALELVDAAILPDRDQVWDLAHRLVLPRLEQWRRESGDAPGGT
jgi:hypothetical protein